MSDDNYGDGGDDINDDFEENNSDDENVSEDYGDQNEGSDAEKKNSDEEDEEEEDQEESSQESNKNYQIIEEDQAPQKPNEVRITSPFITKYQKARVIGVRAVQISKNSPLYLNNQNVANMNWDPLTIAEKELSENKIPFIVRRYLPDGSYEDWKLSELKTFD